MIGRRLSSGLHAVPVIRATLLASSGRYSQLWRLELECGHILERHKGFQKKGGRPPDYVGCPHGCGAEIGAIRQALAQKERGLIAEERRRWARQRERLTRQREEEESS